MSGLSRTFQNASDGDAADFLRHYKEEFGAFGGRVLVNEPGHISESKPDAEKLFC